MTLSPSEAKSLNYSAFFEGLRTIHSDPLALKSIHELEEKTKDVLKVSITQEETWRAKLRYMGGLRAGWNAEDELVSGDSIKAAAEFLTEMDRFMNTTFVEFQADPSGFLSIYWFDFDAALKYQVVINSKDKYTVIKKSALTSASKRHDYISQKDALKKILKWTT